MKCVAAQPKRQRAIAANRCTTTKEKDNHRCGMRLKSMRTIRSLKGKRVLVRVDFNVPIAADGSVDAEGDERIRRALPTIEYLRQQGSVVILAAHLGRPDGVFVEAFRLSPVSKYLAQMMGVSVLQLDEVVGSGVTAAVTRAKPGDILMLENLRFDAREEKNQDDFSRALGELADYYVDDAFGNAHREHSSMVGVTKYCKSYAGLLLAEEVRQLSALTAQPKRPFAAIIGGVKLSTKLAVIKTFVRLADHVLLGGNLANTVLKAAGVAVGKSPVEERLLPTLRSLRFTSTKLHVPLDVVTAPAPDAVGQVATKAVANVQSDEYILDIGPDTLRLFDTIIRDAATIVWNGPMGKFELTPFAAGTLGVVHAIAHTKAKVVVGGGETVAALRQYLPKPVSEYPNLYLSTGGGAMLRFLEHGTLPALEPLRQA